MNFSKHLTDFFDRSLNDPSLKPTHISLYITLFQFWNINRFNNPINIYKNEVMQLSKIASKATYHKCIRELHNKGYIKYHPSHNPFKSSMIYVIEFHTATDKSPNPIKSPRSQE